MPLIVHGKIRKWSEFASSDEGKMMKKLPTGFSAWLPPEIWGEVFRYADAWDVCQCESVCKDMKIAASRDDVWATICAKRGITSSVKADIAAEDIRSFEFQFFFFPNSYIYFIKCLQS